MRLELLEFISGRQKQRNHGPFLPGLRKWICDAIPVLRILQERCDNEKLEALALCWYSKRYSYYIEPGIFTSLHACRNLAQLIIERGCNIPWVNQFTRALPPSLTSLALVVDNTKLEGINIKCPGGGRCNERLKFLALGNSPIESPVNVVYP
ncbi:hypothetical protein DFH29DRAFT_152727 [Suillus ampliporus]|nr:hypothetical protein DFH29DRAFT_152727 [Suillus ampliporus]